jgi:hypothetical protein
MGRKAAEGNVISKDSFDKGEDSRVLYHPLKDFAFVD